MSPPPRPKSRRGAPQAGEVVAGKYEVGDLIGSGGMGVVVAARHLELGQTVAIKFLDRALAENAAASARFFREARAASRIRSEHVTRVLDVARTDKGVPYLVMEHLVGIDLEQVQRTQGTVPIDDVLDYVLQACEALAEAHAAGVVHRDLKPSNLFLTHHADGSPLVKVLDFGISKIIEPGGEAHDGAQTSETDMLGSPWYMSPEQVRSSMSVDARSDVWSLGVILYQLLTGKHAFRGDSMGATLSKIIADQPPPLRSHRPDVPEDLERVVLACLAKDPADRLQSVAELAAALAPFAPERAQFSIVRIQRVLGAKGGAGGVSGSITGGSRDGFTPQPQSAASRALATPASGSSVAPALSGPPPAPTGVTSPTGQSTGASVSTTSASAAPKPSRALPMALVAVAALALGAFGAQRFLAASRAGAPSTSSDPASTSTPAPPGATPTVAPAASVAPSASAAGSAALAAPSSGPSASSAPAAPSASAASHPHAVAPAAPVTPRPHPGKLKIDGPVETSL